MYDSTCWVCGDESDGSEVCADPKCQRLAKRLTTEDPKWTEDFRRREAEEKGANHAS